MNATVSLRKCSPPPGPEFLGGGEFSEGGNFRRVKKLCRPQGAGRLSQNGGRRGTQEEENENKPPPLWLKEQHGLGGEDFCLPETSQKLNPLESPRGGTFFLGENFCLDTVVER